MLFGSTEGGSIQLWSICHLRCEDPPDLVPKSWPELTEVLHRFKDVMDESVDLPPTRSTDHRISLCEGAQLVNVHPYRYPHFQKNEIEKLTIEMLQTYLSHCESILFSGVACAQKGQ